MRDEGEKTKGEKSLKVKFSCRSLALNENTKACYNQSTSYNMYDPALGYSKEFKSSGKWKTALSNC